MLKTLVMNRFAKVILSILAPLAAAGIEHASAQGAGIAARLANAKRVECVFTTKVTGDWDGDKTSASVAVDELKASFFDVDVDGGTAEAEGRFGSTYIVVRYTNGYLHFMQMSNSGPLYITTVLARETSNGRLMAIHTRHEYVPTSLPGFTSRPEMYLGDCSIET